LYLFLGISLFVILFLAIFLINLNLTGKITFENLEDNISSIKSEVFIEKVETETEIFEIEVNVTTTKQKIMLNQPVKWKKNIKLSRKSNISIEIPSISENIL